MNMRVPALSEKQLSTTFNQAAIGIAHSSTEGRFLRVNRKLCSMLGYSEEELLRLSILEITHPDDVPASKTRIRALLEGDTGAGIQEAEKRYVHKDGSAVWVAIAVAVARTELGVPQFFITTVQDITGRKRAEALTALEHSVARCLAAAGTASDRMKAVIRAICESEKWEVGRYWRVDAAADVLRPGEPWCVSDPVIEQFLQSSAGITFGRGVGWVGLTWETGTPQWVADVSAETRLVKTNIVRETGMRSIFAFPVVSEGATLGVLSFVSRAIREPDARLLETAASIGNQVGQFLRRSQAEEGLLRFRAAMDVSADLVFLIDPVSLRYVDANEAAARALGYSLDELTSMGPLDIFSSTREQLSAAYRALIAGDLGGTAVEGFYRCKDGSRIYVESFRRAVPSGLGHVIVSVARDLTARKQGEEALRRFRAAMDATSDAIYLTDRATLRFLDVNDAACRMQGVTRKELMERGPDGVLGQSREELAAVYDSVISGGEACEPFELSRMRNNGALAWVELQRRAQHTGEGWMIITVVRDITERKKLEARLLQQANYDSLTGLPNRLLSYDRLNQALIQARRKSGNAALLFIDLDRFKQVNDTLGHGIGDLLLQQVSSRLKLCVRAGDTVGRLGGDEFVIVLPEIADARHSALIARKALDALAGPFELDGHKAEISGSIGIATSPTDGDTVEDLIRNADSAMFAAKQAGRNAYRFFGDKA